jgi:hypothetical protein
MRRNPLHTGIRRVTLTLAAATLALSAGLATATAASASPAARAAVAVAAAPSQSATNGPVWQPFFTGYEINSSLPFNENRGTVTIPAGSTSSVAIGMETNVNGGEIFAIGLIYNPADHGFYLADVSGAGANVNTGSPIGPGVTITPVATNGFPALTPLFFNNTQNSYYLETHYSTREHLIQFVAGPSETDNATLGVSFAFSDFLHAPFTGVFNLAGFALALNSPQASFSRDGITEPAGSNVGGVAGTRVTFDSNNWALDESEAIALCPLGFTITPCGAGSGSGPTVADPATMVINPALPQTSSDWGATAGSI